jgi:leucyl/phenylalanyl-tRNA---protein transferase
MDECSPQALIYAYRHGFFPMAPDRHSHEIRWFSPNPRAVIPLDAFRLSRSLAKRLRQAPFRITADTDFEAVIGACAAARPDDPDTWISGRIVAAYTQLHRLGFGHSIECWQGDELAGGLYGLAIGGAFFAESMFHRRTDASKIALAHLVKRLRHGRFRLLDVQYWTPHLGRFGTVEISRRDYLSRLSEALAIAADWSASDAPADAPSPPDGGRINGGSAASPG